MSLDKGFTNKFMTSNPPTKVNQKKVSHPISWSCRKVLYQKS